MSVRRNFRHLVLCVAAVFTFGSLLWAQIDQGAIRGTVHDPSGAVVPGAKVTLTNEDTGLALDTSTSNDGSYSFSPIKIGTYTVAVAKPGFQTVSQPHVAVHVNEQVKADFSLTPGQVSQTVEVTSALPVLQTQSSTVGQDITQQQVNDLPLKRPQLYFPCSDLRRGHGYAKWQGRRNGRFHGQRVWLGRTTAISSMALITTMTR